MTEGTGGLTSCIDIVIVNWNAGDQLRDCIQSVLRHSNGLVAQIIVVDNASSDGSANLVTDPLVTVVSNPRNLGFAKACNQGAALGTAPFVLFLNPDTEMRKGTLTATVAAMQMPEAADVALCTVRMVDAEGQLQRTCSKFPNVATFTGQSVGLQGRFGFPTSTMAETEHRYDRDVGSVIGAFYFIRRSVFEALGGFDERFFIYYEEMDLSLRVHGAGWRTRYLAEPVAMHRGGGTTDQVKALRMFYSLRSRLLYSFKNLPRTQAWGVAALTVLIEPLGRLARALARRSLTEAREAMAGYVLLVRDLPNIVDTVRRGARD